MPEVQQDEYKFPDEGVEVGGEVPEGFEVEIEDDTPEEDRGRQPMPKPIVEELEQDDLDQYDEKVKGRLKQMRKVWHDERRAKEEAFREQQEAVSLANQLFEENKRIRTTYEAGGKEFTAVMQRMVELEMEGAKRAYKEAYDSGDSDKVLEAQQALQIATNKQLYAQNFRVPSLHRENYTVQPRQEQTQQPAPRPLNPKLVSWQERNSWYGSDDEMTAAALGIHEKLRKSGDVDIGSDDYYAILDKTIRRRFPERFESEESGARAPARTRPSTVVAPAVRSTTPTKIRLRSSQVALAKKLGLTPEQYALELRKLEAKNG